MTVAEQMNELRYRIYRDDVLQQCTFPYPSLYLLIMGDFYPKGVNTVTGLCHKFRHYNPLTFIHIAKYIFHRQLLQRQRIRLNLEIGI